MFLFQRAFISRLTPADSKTEVYFLCLNHSLHIMRIEDCMLALLGCPPPASWVFFSGKQKHSVSGYGKQKLMFSFFSCVWLIRLKNTLVQLLHRVSTSVFFRQINHTHEKVKTIILINYNSSYLYLLENDNYTTQLIRVFYNYIALFYPVNGTFGNFLLSLHNNFRIFDDFI